MDLRAYYQKIRETENRITETFPVVMSREGEGGKRGICTEVSRALAAKMLVEGSAREATAEEVKAFRKSQADARRLAEQEQAAKTVQFQVVSMDDVKKLAGSAKGAQDRS
jgi:hypothetical protein